ncbi:MAG: ATPase, T2SS/T4P/T4SS family [Planctomycetota bacterium]|nr:ATPase, T2SS/T4P/T4SS family [Planctomycetota bacterium]MCZ6817566.1 ATPase, T2SS/T4P/T4SS family [Planctomycetota bacterium]
MPRLEITAEGRKSTVSFNGASVSIGRQADNDIVINDSKASRKHCVIKQNAGTFRIKDFSQNGTWIGQNRVDEGIIALGDVLRIGATFIRLLPDLVEGAEARNLPTAAVVIEDDDEELPQARVDRSNVKTTLAMRAIGTGPLSKQLAPLMAATVNVPVPEGAPENLKDVVLLDRKSKPIAIDRRDKSRPSEALEAFRQLVFACIRLRASDVHIEPKPDVYTIRCRIDGQLQAVGEVPAKIGTQILNIIKILCQADIAQKSIVQEGGFGVELPSRRIDMRVNMTPTVHGQKLALRFLDKATVPDQFENLGMELDAVAQFRKICNQDAGLIVIAGPTGSGKTTTLYTALKTVDAKTRNIVTIEDPVEYELEYATQISIDPGHNLTFASVLSSVLRQDPDVILVGEIRDQETAKLAMQAAMTGHLVMTTVHARDSIGTIFRLLDLGVEPFLIANAVSMCLTQRLVRVLCPECKRAYKPDAHIIREMKLEDRPHGEFYDPVGCERCMNVGYRGRMALFELLVFNAQLRDVILTQPTIADIRKAAGEWMFRTLTASGYRKVIEGTTAFEEVSRIVSTV